LRISAEKEKNNTIEWILIFKHTKKCDGILSMPSISEFFGISIYMYHAHGQHKAPYFHARYQGGDASFAIETTEVLAGKLPPKVVKLIQEWAKRHKNELHENWNLIMKNDRPQYIQGADND